MEELVSAFIKIREKKSQLKAEYEAKVAKYDETANKIEAVLLAKFNEMGLDSIKTPAGTAYASVRASATVADWDAFKTFLQSTDDPYFFIERRVNKTAVEQYKAANEDLPPGVNWSETRVVNFRKS